MSDKAKPGAPVPPCGSASPDAAASGPASTGAAGRGNPANESRSAAAPSLDSPRGDGAVAAAVCHACGAVARSQGQSPPPSWWQDPADPDTCLCEDCRRLMREIQKEGERWGVVIAPEHVRAARALRRMRRLHTRPVLGLQNRS